MTLSFLLILRITYQYSQFSSPKQVKTSQDPSGVHVTNDKTILSTRSTGQNSELSRQLSSGAPAITGTLLPPEVTSPPFIRSSRKQVTGPRHRTGRHKQFFAEIDGVDDPITAVPTHDDGPTQLKLTYKYLLYERTNCRRSTGLTPSVPLHLLAQKKELWPITRLFT